MLDRLSLSLVSLPPITYDVILILLDADNTRRESKKLLNGDLLSRIIQSLKPGGEICSQDGAFAMKDADERREAILAGLLVEGTEVTKPRHEAIQSVPLSVGRKKKDGGAVAVTSAAGTGAVSLNLNGKRENGSPDATKPSGVGFVDFSDDLNSPEIEEDGDDDGLIDENTLLDEEDMKRPVVQRKPSDSPLLVVMTQADGVFSHRQLQSVAPKPVNVGGPAKTALAAWPNGSTLKTKPRDRMRIKRLRSSKGMN